jgi:hypothetical protein
MVYRILISSRESLVLRLVSGACGHAPRKGGADCHRIPAMSCQVVKDRLRTRQTRPCDVISQPASFTQAALGSLCDELGLCWKAKWSTIGSFEVENPALSLVHTSTVNTESRLFLPYAFGGSCRPHRTLAIPCCFDLFATSDPSKRLSRLTTYDATNS